MAGFRGTLCARSRWLREGGGTRKPDLRLPLVAVDQLGGSGSGKPTITVIPDKARTVAEFFNLHC
jgi:hypothetical protein